MLTNPSAKYRAFAPVTLPDRTWPSRTITQAPVWLSTDLRDGNQALIEPMDGERKRRFFDLLVKSGFKEIEVGFPSASQTEFDFVRELIDGDRIPQDVWIQVLTQARPELIERTFEALRGAPRAIVHFYGATAPNFRRIVFGQDKAGTVALAVAAAKQIKELAQSRPETEWRFEYSPEVFSGTELDFAVEICDAVLDVYQPTPDRKVILNLPATVEMSTPNIYADQIEWFGRHVGRRDSVLISVHPHNDRGTGVAAAELAVMAGADRVEGCLFGNGERTGNVDIVTLALNMYTQGVAPGLDFSDMQGVVKTVEYCNQLPVHPRHPYAGDLVFTAFSGSHQDAIKKGFADLEGRNDEHWELPYLPIDPADIGCSYEAVIRVNSQSGKGGVAWLLEQDRGLKLPRRLQMAFSKVVQEISDRTGKEQTAADIWDAFRKTYHLDGEPRIQLIDHQESGTAKNRTIVARIRLDGRERSVTGHGNGPISAFIDAIRQACGVRLDLVDYQEHTLRAGADAQAASYIEFKGADGATIFGVGLDEDIATSSLKAVASAANTALGGR
ncbi:MAG TPA: 2-isopropylmalate synthase [Aliidongia sp.]|uniref:2-isopropylmalate synthase n=1 Tax=Aliidongia sp. TaxID=1914230 RepID=UPI002DDD8691|nr:2-isopropylmalate synthase [Aliidongia sp.]HEV2674302.1 2-isopropylmalate synthase [Aliidongia sp.]